MNSIRPATEEDIPLLIRLAIDTFRESHGHSAAEADLVAYIDKKYTEEGLRAELRAEGSRYHIVYAGDQPAGFSWLVLNTPCPGIDEEPLAKLERIYVLREFYDRKLGGLLFDNMAALARAEGQRGLWLYVWTKNERALRFYRKQGFEVVGHYDFQLSATHSNPNYRMLLRF